MKVYIVLKDMGTYEIDNEIVRVFSTEKAAQDYINEQVDPHNYNCEDWIVWEV